jgi:hypothetical protein
MDIFWISARRTFEFAPGVELTLADLGGTMAEASTSLGEASARIQATDLKCRKTPRVRTAPPGLRVEPKWLPGLPGYAVQCQSSVERGAATGTPGRIRYVPRAPCRRPRVPWPRGGVAR